MFYGTEGYMEINGDTWRAYRQRETEPFAGSGMAEEPADPTYMAPPGGTEHYANFVDAIRSGNSEELHCDILEGYMSSALPLLANVSYRVGRELKFDGEKEKFVNDTEADKLLTRKYRKPYVVPEEV